MESKIKNSSPSRDNNTGKCCLYKLVSCIVSKSSNLKTKLIYQLA